MKNLILFDDDIRDHLLPLTFTRPICELRIGILTIREKWEKWLGIDASYITQDYLSEKYPLKITSENIVINGSVMPSERLCRLVKQLDFNEALLQDGELIAAKLNKEQFEHLMNNEDIQELVGYELVETPFLKINHPWDIFMLNEIAIAEDFEFLTKGRTSQAISTTNIVLGDRENIFLEEGASVECATLNAKKGPIYIGKDAEVMEGTHIRGALALCEGAKLKLGAKVYGATTIGPYSKVGGEVSNIVITGYSNKGHDGYLGNAVLGEWCNIGADSNNSNLKNNYAEVRLWDYLTEKFIPTGLQFCGLIMGDHSKCGINTMFNTGTVIGVSANVFGAGFPRNFVPSFSWGGASGYSTYRLDKVCEVAEKVMARRKVDFTETDKNILANIFEQTSSNRRWETSS